MATNLPLLRAAILRILDANKSRFGITADAVMTFMPSEGFAGVARSEVQAGLEWLKDRQFVTCPDNTLDPETAYFRITAAGRDQL
jgi:hypothetical protein